MSDDPLRAGVIGTGSMGQNHVRVYRELSDVELVGIHDVDEERAREVARERETAALSKAELLEAADVVSIAVPTQFHYETARECLEAGVHVLVEKPFVEDPEQGQKLIDLARLKGVQIQVGHVERYNPAVQTVAEFVDDLDVIAIEAERLGPPPGRHIDDSAVMDLMIHDLDVVSGLIDSHVTELQGTATDDGCYANATLRFDDGTVGRLTASRVTQRKVRTLSINARECRVEIDYIDQSVEVHRHSMPEFIEENGNVRYRHENLVERLTVQNSEPLREEIADFVEAIREDRPPRVTGEDGLRALRLAQAIEVTMTGDSATPAEESLEAEPLEADVVGGIDH
ncbi:Gfo/Idh/MocA family protein [Natrononativus amylolyticus]|uniref:Gfo/Idh/MocA family protein n=1 Tax=Natrononativus amylolyticus TaxID=2963434 RepID=UPI0020CCCC16|nr:Gfo/Idh/MocA family oxidoreductase [Natrononativus amylolyticus]